MQTGQMETIPLAMPAVDGVGGVACEDQNLVLQWLHCCWYSGNERVVRTGSA
jgi:hypothetical protein